MGAAAAVSALLSSCADVRFLVTSRVALRIGGERLYPVSPMSREEAVELFAERARRVKPELALNGVVGEICDRLDRLPLAIELAAARVRVLTPPAMLARLEQRLPLLTGGARDVPTRQQTLEGAIAWSYELLEPEHQRLFARLAVFNGGRAFEAIEAICNPEGDTDVLTGIETLCDGSLLNQQEDADGEARFVMLETIHEYAGARLAELPEAEELRRRHALYFHGLATGRRQRAAGEGWGGVASTVPAEIDNLRLALDWLGEQGESGLELEMAAQLGKFWRDWGLLAEGKQRLEHALSRAPAEPSSELVWALIALGVIHEYAGDFSAALPFDERALDAARRVEDDTLVLRASNNLGLCLLTVGDYAGGEIRLQEGVKLAEDVGDDLVAAAGPWQPLVWAAITRGDWEEARTRCQRVIELASGTGSEYVVAVTRCNLGWATGTPSWRRVGGGAVPVQPRACARVRPA